MMHKLQKEEDILDPKFRQSVIKEITEGENVSRKKRDLRRHEVYKDRTKKYVIESLSNEFKVETVARMQNRASNISICKKIINKLAKAYAGGVDRTIGEDIEKTKVIQNVAKILGLDAKMKKADRYSELFKNCALQVIPEKDTRESEGDSEKFHLKLRVLPPYMYDVIEDAADPEVPRVFILTDFVERDQMVAMGLEPGTDGRGQRNFADRQRRGDGREAIIADSSEDNGSQCRTFIWWSQKYHFTTDDKGQIINEMSPEGKLNPIQELPFVNISEDQDGSFWAEGGDDLVDGSILVNVIITDMLAIANQQGWGQLVVIGKNIKTKLEGGPHTALILEPEANEKCEADYISSNPPLDNWMRMIEQYVALLLSTNNLSTRQVASKLDATNMASGIALMIENSESTEDVSDKQEMFSAKEPMIWKLIRAWFEYLNGKQALIASLAEIGELPEEDPQTKFKDTKPVVTEAERLENLKRRKDLGINTLVELIKLDNPGMTDEDAEKKALALVKERLQAQRMAQGMGIQGEDNGKRKEGGAGSAKNQADEKADQDRQADA